MRMMLLVARTLIAKATFLWLALIGRTATPEDRVALAAYNPDWASAFAVEAERLQASCGRACRLFIDHVGSTSVPGLLGKPVIDVLVTLPDWNAVDTTSKSLKLAGYRIFERIGGCSPRRFMRRDSSLDGPAFNLHLVPEGSEWGLRMLAFRDVLANDRPLMRQYAELKTTLAEAYPDDLGGYTSGKAIFVGNALMQVEGAFSVNRLLTHQRTELNRAQKLQVAAVAAQLTLACVAAASVFFSDGASLLTLAVVGFVLAIGWFEIGRRSGRHRTAGNQARRAVLLASGLGQSVSPEQRLRIFDGFALSIQNRQLVREEDYFASRSGPGYRRAAELIEESAYWTRDLQKTSAGIVTVALVLIGAALFMAAWRGVVDVTGEAQINVARVLIAALVFLLSSEVLGALLGHRRAARSINEILQRVEATTARNYPEADVMLLISDYNAAVESAPVVLPLVYRCRRDDLSRQWRAYLAAKLS